MIVAYPSAALNAERRTIPNELIGAQIGGQQFVHAMLRYLPAKSVGLFVPETQLAAMQRDLERLQENEGGNFITAEVWALRELPAVVRSREFMAFHNAGGPWLDNLAYVRSEFAGVPFPITCSIHGISYQNTLWDFYTRLCLLPALPCDSIICTSRPAQIAFRNCLEYVAEGLKQAGVTWNQSDIRLDMLPLGVDTAIFAPKDRLATRQLLGLPQDKTVILCFGRIDHGSKGDLNPLFIAFHELIRRHPHDLVLVLAGVMAVEDPNSLRQAAERLGVGSEVLIRLQPSLVEGPLYYAAADVFVSLSETLQESFGLAPLEAMASGLPAVVTDWSGFRDTVVHGKTGFRVTTRWGSCSSEVSLLSPLYGWRDDHLKLSQSVAADIDELIEYLDTLVKNPEKRQAMGSAAREHVVRNYDWQPVMRQYYGLWQELKNIASRCTTTETSVAQLCRAAYFRNFKHFATECLQGGEVLELTERGRNACRQPASIMCHPEMDHILNRRMITIVLRLLRFSRFIKIHMTVGDICEKIGPRHGLTSEGALAHILWMMKYGLIRVKAASSSK